MAVVIRARKFLTNKLLSRKQMVIALFRFSTWSTPSSLTFPKISSKISFLKNISVIKEVLFSIQILCCLASELSSVADAPLDSAWFMTPTNTYWNTSPDTDSKEPVSSKRKSTPERATKKSKESAKEPEAKKLPNSWDSNSIVPWNSENRRLLTSRPLLPKTD